MARSVAVFFSHLSAVATAIFILTTASEHAGAAVTATGDVQPPFAAASAVNLSGQRILIGSTVAGVGQVGTVSVTGGGVLTAAQLVAGYGGQGIGFVTVTGTGSIVNLTGGAASNGLDIGSWGTGTMTVSNGGSVACASAAACAFSAIGNGAGSTGSLVINGGSVTGLGSLGIAQGTLINGFGTPGANTTGTLSISNGGILTTSGFSSVASNSGLTGAVSGSVSIDGAGSRWTIGRDLAGGGGQAGLTIGRNANATATATVSNGGLLSIVGSRSSPATDNSLPNLSLGTNAGATTTMTVTTGGMVRIGGDTGVLNVGGTNTSTGGTATLNITGGGTVAGTGANGLVFVGIGRLDGTGTVNVSGAGSLLAVSGVGGQNTQGLDGVGGLIRVGSNTGGNGTLNITNSGSVTISDGGVAVTNGMGMRIGATGAVGNVTVSGAGSSILITSSGSATTTPTFVVGNGGIGQMTISNGATVSLLGLGERDFTVNNSGTGSGTLTMSNNASVIASRFAVADNGGSGTATIDHSSIQLDGVVNFNGLIGAGLRVGRGVGADGTLNLQNGSTVTIANSTDSASVILGGTAALAGGTGHLNMSGGSSITFTGTASNASLQVGGLNGTGFMSMTDASNVNVGATGAASVGATVGSSGTLNIASGSSITANVINIGGSSDTAAGGTGTVTIAGAGSALIGGGGGTGLIAVGRGGTGSLTVSNQGAVSGISFSVGRDAGGVGTLAVNQGVVSLSGQQTVANTLSGANLSIGIANGIGSASISNGSVVTISNLGTLGASLNVGGRPDPPGAGGTGVLTVTNSQINLAAASGQSVVRIGYDGAGTAIFNNSQLNIGNATASGADGNLLIGAQATGTGLLSLNGGSTVNANYVGVGATQSGPGGSGTLILNNSTINAQSFELGASGLLTGNGGRLHIADGVLIGGTLSPGNSPGALLIDCNIVTLPGSLLILDVLSTGVGFDIDHLRIGNTSTFDLHSLHILLNFLGNTDPTAFAASGGLDLDNFLQAYDEASGALSGLSTLFAAGESWLNVVGAGNITAASSSFDISNIRLAADGSIAVVAAPIPEPETWSLLVVGLMLVNLAARRRRAAARSH